MGKSTCALLEFLLNIVKANLFESIFVKEDKNPSSFIVKEFRIWLACDPNPIKGNVSSVHNRQVGCGAICLNVFSRLSLVRLKTVAGYADPCLEKSSSVFLICEAVTSCAGYCHTVHSFFCLLCNHCMTNACTPQKWWPCKYFTTLHFDNSLPGTPVPGNVHFQSHVFCFATQLLSWRNSNWYSCLP